MTVRCLELSQLIRRLSACSDGVHCGPRRLLLARQMRSFFYVMLLVLAASCGKAPSPAAAPSPGRALPASVPARLAQLQASATKPSSVTEDEIKDLCKAIVWPGVEPYGTVVAVDGWCVAVQCNGSHKPVRPGVRVLVTTPEGPCGLLRVDEVVGGYMLGQLVSTVGDRVASVGSYAQPLP